MDATWRRPARRRGRGAPALLHLLALGGPVITGGCAGLRTVTVAVREEQTHEPVESAEVRFQPIEFYVPMMMTILPNCIITPVRCPDEAAVTDAAGMAVLRAPAHRPFDLCVLIPGEPPRAITVTPETAEGAWLALRPDEAVAGAPVLEIRLGAGE